MAFDSVPWIIDGSTIDGEVIRRAVGSLISPAGGIVTAGDLTVAQQTVANMSVQIAAGEIWVPGSTIATQGPYYSRNGAPVTVTISASDPSNPRIDTIIAQVVDQTYAGSGRTLAPVVIIGTPTAGATLANLNGKGTVPASSVVLAYVLVPASATSIVTANIANVAARSARSPFGVANLNFPTSQTATPLTVPHGLGKLPQLVLLTSNLFPGANNSLSLYADGFTTSSFVLRGYSAPIAIVGALSVAWLAIA